LAIFIIYFIILCDLGNHVALNNFINYITLVKKMSKNFLITCILYHVNFIINKLIYVYLCLQYTAIDSEGLSLAVAGRTGLAHYSLPSRKWKLFGNESQERDFIVTGGLLWHKGYLIASSYSILDDKDEIRIYPRDTRLDNNYVKSVRMPSQVLLLNTTKDRLLTFCANAQISIYDMVLQNGVGKYEIVFAFKLNFEKFQSINEMVVLLF